jgi:UDP-N-acetylmuramate--alanine ligase
LPGRLHRDHGVLVACADDEGARQLVQRHRQGKKLAFTYGLENGANLRAENIEVSDAGASFDVVQAGTTRGRATLSIPGRHNVQNALAALYVAGPGHDQALEDVIPHLASFRSTGARFDVRADVDGIAVIDDYAHHPTAIRATIAATRARYPNRALWVVWQPHTYSRTAALWDGFISSFNEADHVRVTDIYAARETPVEGVDGVTIAEAISHNDVRCSGSLESTTADLVENITAEAVILILSAGTAPQIGVEFLKQRGLNE